MKKEKKWDQKNILFKIEPQVPVGVGTAKNTKVNMFPENG